MALRGGLLALGLLALAMFFDVLLAPGGRVLGAGDTDIANHFLHWRDFGFAELARGNLALWNPYTYSGMPYFGGMQAALLYPLNWLYLALPVSVATNWTIALGVWLLGAFMYLWALRRGLHPFAALVCAALLMFCAPHFLRVYAGHPTSLAAMSWIPLVFLATDEWLATRRAGWLLAGMLAVALQIFAGHPQTVYLTALSAGIYSLARVSALPERRIAAAAGLAGLYAGAVLLAAVQLGAGLQAGAQTLRGAAVPLSFAASMAFPAENVITLLAPGFFGDVSNRPYWGRWYLWEASLFIGVVGLALAAYGAAGRVPGRGALLATGAVAALLALGDQTPLFGILYEWLPLFDRFRGSGKFVFITALVLALFAGYGLDRILRERRVSARAIAACGVGALALAAAAAAASRADWRPIAASVMAGRGSYAEARLYFDPAFLGGSQAFAALGLALAAATLAAAAALMLATRRWPRAAFLLGALAVTEIFAFARLYRPTFDATQAGMAQLRDFLAADPGDYRVLNLALPNRPLSLRAFDAWGYDPGITRRYAEFIEWSTGGDPALATQEASFQRLHPLLAMLRVKYIVALDGVALKIVPALDPPLRRLELIGAYQVHTDRAAILNAMAQPSFDPRREVILERAPEPVPRAAAVLGQAAIVREGTDFLEIEADLPRAALLVVTDAWAAGWRAVALPGSSRVSYDLAPANYVLRAVALSEGKHRLRLEYAPAAFRIGAGVSLLAWIVWAAAAWRLLARREESLNA